MKSLDATRSAWNGSGLLIGGYALPGGRPGEKGRPGCAIIGEIAGDEADGAWLLGGEVWPNGGEKALPYCEGGAGPL